MTRFLTEEDVARLCSRIDIEFCLGIGDTENDWWIKPEWRGDSTMAAIKFIIANPTATIQDLHEFWLAYKISSGWIYGSKLNSGGKQSPWLIDYSALPDEQLAKDSVFLAIVKSLLPFIIE